MKLIRAALWKSLHLMSPPSFIYCMTVGLYSCSWDLHHTIKIIRLLLFKRYFGSHVSVAPTLSQGEILLSRCGGNFTWYFEGGKMPSERLKSLCGDPDSTQTIRWIYSVVLRLFSRKHQLQQIVLVAFQFSASGLARAAEPRLCDACLESFDTVQISADPPLLNKHMSLGTRRLMLLPLNSGISLSLAGQDFGVCG